MISYFAMIPISFCLQLRQLNCDKRLKVVLFLLIMMMVMNEGKSEIGYLFSFKNSQGTNREY